MKWYQIFSIISGTLILIAVFVLAFKMINAGMNTAKKNEAKENLMRLCFGGVAIALAPLFIRFLLYMNNSLVYFISYSSKYWHTRCNTWKQYANKYKNRKCHFNSTCYCNVYIFICKTKY